MQITSNLGAVKKMATRLITHIAVGAIAMCVVVGACAVAKADGAMDDFREIADVEFLLSSGAGAWGTSLRINADGTFTGDYHDTDMGDTGETYPSGTVYSCEFSGKFKDLKKIDEHTYSFELDCLKAEDPKEEFIDKTGTRIVPAEPCGLETGKTYALYLPGSKVNGLPDEFVRWVSMPMAWTDNEIPDLLPFYGIYNADGKYGFWGSKEDNKEISSCFDRADLLLTFSGVALLIVGVAFLRGKCDRKSNNG